MWHAERVLLPLLGVAPLLLSQDHDGAAVQAGESALNGAVGGVAPVAAQLEEVVAHQANVIARVRASSVTCDLYTLPWGESGVDLAGALLQLLLVIGQLRALLGPHYIRLLFE